MDQITPASAPIAHPIGAKINFKETMNRTWEMYKKNFVVLTALFAVPVIITNVIGGLIGNNIPTPTQKNLWYVAAILLAFVLVSAVLKIISYIAVVRGTIVAEKEQIQIGSVVNFVLKRLKTAIGLSIRIFFYSGAWAMIILSALPALLFFLGAPISIIGPITFIAPILIIIVLLIYIKKIVHSTFAFPILLSNDTIGSKEALDASIKLTDGLTGTIFSNGFLLGLCIWIFTMVTYGLIEMVAPTKIIADYTSLIPDIFAGTFSAVFILALMKKVEAAKIGPSPSWQK